MKFSLEFARSAREQAAAVPAVPERRIETDSSLENPSIDLVQALVAMTDGTTVSSVSLTPAKSLRLTAVYACVRKIAESIASMPFPIRSAAGRARAKVVGDKRELLLNIAPNEEQTAMELLETWIANALLWGKGHIYVDWDRSGQPRALWPLRPDRTEEKRTKKGERYWVTTLDSGERVPLADYMVIPLHAIYGLSPIRTMRDPVSGAIAADEYAFRFWANNARPGGLIELGDRNWDEQEYEEFRRRWRAGHEGLKRSHLVGILSGGATWKDVGIPPQQAQMLEQRQFGIEEIARIFGVPPHMIGHLDKTTNRATIEQQSVEFVTYTLRPWIVRAEQAVRKGLFLVSDADIKTETYPEFHADALLRGDMKSLYDAYAVGVQWGWLSRADVREKLGEIIPEDQDLDEYLVPLNMTTSGMIKKLQAQQLSPEQASAIAYLAMMMRSGSAGDEAAEMIPDLSRFLSATVERELAALPAGDD